MSRNALYGLLAVLSVGIVLLGGYLIYQQQSQPHLEIKFDKSGVEVKGNG